MLHSHFYMVHFLRFSWFFSFLIFTCHVVLSFFTIHFYAFNFYYFPLFPDSWFRFFSFFNSCFWVLGFIVLSYILPVAFFYFSLFLVFFSFFGLRDKAFLSTVFLYGYACFNSRASGCFGLDEVFFTGGKNRQLILSLWGYTGTEFVALSLVNTGVFKTL